MVSCEVVALADGVKPKIKDAPTGTHKGTDLFGVSPPLSTFFQFIKDTLMPATNCLGNFTVSRHLDSDEYCLSYKTTKKLGKGSRQVDDPQGRILTLQKKARGLFQCLGSAEIYLNGDGHVDLNKFHVDLTVVDTQTRFVMLSGIFEFCRQTRLKELLQKTSVRSLEAASPYPTLLTDRCNSQDDFINSGSKKNWSAFKISSSCYSRECWSIPSDPSDIYASLLGCPGGFSIQFKYSS